MNKGKILLVEDDAVFRKLYVDIFKEAGYEVTEAEDGEKGLKYAQEGNFDLMIFDIMLPKLDGLAIMTEYKKTPPKDNPPKIIFFTNLAQESMVTKAKELGVAQVIVKSDITPDKMVETINNLLKK
jgi:DNA-binding response OmpR family regulator